MEQKELKVSDKRTQIPEEKAISTEVRGDNFLTIFQIASQKNYDPAFIKEMMGLREKEEAYQAKKAYTKAMADFKKDAPEIEKDRLVKYQAGGQTVQYRHASLANVCKKISSALGEYGLHAAWQTEQTNGDIKVICTITHEQGHSESIYLSAKPDTSGSKNSIQAIGSTISYLERYTLLALTGLATHDMDDDGQGPGEPEYITEKEYGEVYDLVLDTDTNVQKFCEFFEIEDVKYLPADRLDEAMRMLKSKHSKKL